MPEGVGYGPQYTASTGLELNVVGDFAYAYSGLIQISTSAVDQLVFTTGSYLLVGKFTGGTNIKVADPPNGGITIYQIYFNGVEALRLKVSQGPGSQGMPTALVVPLIIPPLTVVSITATSQYATADFESCASITGRVYK